MTSGLWGFPQVTPFKNEHYDAAAAREVKEEVGRDINVHFSRRILLRVIYLSIS